ncbi:MAG: hypothetical protein HY279_00535 [Nitrospinae bacterium]|nr:hypothetical protein [Nitrospinota bacterium]
MVLFSIASLLPSVREAVMDITPIEILQIEPAVEEKPEDIPESLPEKEIQKIKEEIIKEPKITKAVEAPPPAPIEKEIQEVIAETPPPIIEETFEKPAQEIMAAESTESTPDEISLKSEAKISGITKTTSSIEQAKPVSLKYGVDGGTGSGNGKEMSLFRAMVRTKIERAKFYPRWAR